MNKAIARKGVILALCISLLTGCATDGSFTKEELGTGIGVVAGAVAGQLIGGGKGRILAALAGAVIGGIIGNQIGAALDEADRVAINRESAKSLALAEDGTATTWSNSTSGASAVIKPSNSRVETRKVTMLRDKGVEKPQQLELIGKVYQAKSSARVRSGPSKESEVTGNLKSGETFTAAGRVTGTKWIAVSRDGRNIGYVHGSLVKEASKTTQMAAAQETELRKAVDLDQLSTNMEKGGVDLDAEGVVADEVVASTECRTVNLDITAKNGQQEQNTMNACRAADGAWEIL